MFVALIWFFLDLFALTRSFETSSCQDAVFIAGTQWSYFSTPNYPKQFPKQTQCNWIIRAPRRFRVELQFESFYLLGGTDKKKSCFVQHLTIRDLFSNVLDGRYCGNTLPPSVVSTGRSIRVALESNAVRLNKLFYKGFQAKFRASRQPSSLRLRDLQGNWKRYTVVGGEVTTTTTAATLPTRDPNEIDDNNNADIDAANNQINNQINNQNKNNNENVNKQNNQQNMPPDIDMNTVLIKKRPGKKRLPPRRKIPVNKGRNKRPKPHDSRIVGLNPAPRPDLSVILHENDNNKQSSFPNMEIIIGSVVGAVMFIILATIILVWRVRRKKTKLVSSKRSQSSRPRQDRCAIEVKRSHSNFAKDQGHRPNIFETQQRAVVLLQRGANVRPGIITTKKMSVVNNQLVMPELVQINNSASKRKNAKVKNKMVRSQYVLSKKLPGIA